MEFKDFDVTALRGGFVELDADAVDGRLASPASEQFFERFPPDRWECFPSDGAVHAGGQAVVGEIWARDDEGNRGAVAMLKVFLGSCARQLCERETLAYAALLSGGKESCLSVPACYGRGDYALGDGTRHPALVLERIEGTALSELLGSLGRSGRTEVGAPETYQLTECIAEALVRFQQALGGEGAHLDLSGENVMIREEGQACSAVILDLAQACVPSEGLAGSCGSLPFAAPEVVELGRSDETARLDDPCKADVWSLGMLACYIRTGAFQSRMLSRTPVLPPLPATSSADACDGRDEQERAWSSDEARRELEACAQRGQEGDRALARFVRRCTQLNPHDRFDSPADALAILQGDMARLGYDKLDTVSLARLGKRRVRFSAGGSSVTGHREKNDDAYRIWAKDGVVFAAVSDGIGGAPDGGIVSRVACGKSLETFERERCLESAFVAGNDTATYITGLIDSPQSGATLLLASSDGFAMDIAWVGDSFLYRLREGKLERLTSVGRRGDGNALEAAVGYDYGLRPHCAKSDVKPGDRFLLCTDGVWETYEKALGIERLAELLASSVCTNLSAFDTSRSIVGEAGSFGSDNATAVVLVASEQPACEDGFPSANASPVA